MKIEIKIGEISLLASLNNSKTAKAIYKEIPFTFFGHYWGDEVYGTIPVSAGEENSVEIIEEAGTLAYWPEGDAFCIFWGPTPVSRGNEIRPASAVNIIGKVNRGLEDLIQARPERLKIELLKVREKHD